MNAKEPFSKGFTENAKTAKNCKQKRVLVYLPYAHAQLLDKLVGLGFYPNRNEAIRMGVRDLLIAHRQIGGNV